MCDWEACTTATTGLPNPNQRSVAKTSGFLHPYIYRYAARAFLRERILALEGEGITWMGEPSRQGIALFSVRTEFWRSTTQGTATFEAGQQPARILRISSLRVATCRPAMRSRPYSHLGSQTATWICETAVSSRHVTKTFFPARTACG